jgi:hypothetical protein
MKPRSIFALVLTLGSLPVNVGVVYAIVRIDNGFLLSPVYPVIFGVLVPLLLLIPLWVATVRARPNGKSLVLPILAILAVVISGGLHFLIAAIASASV